MFEVAGLTGPAAPELRGGGRFVVSPHDDSVSIAVDDSPVELVDMRYLVARLLSDARACAVEVCFGARIDEVHVGVEGRLRSLTFRTTTSGSRAHGQTVVTADLFVDATGMNAALRRRVPLLAETCLPPQPGDVCTAAQGVYRVRDREGAMRWLDRRGLRPTDIAARLGKYGGFSTANVRLSDDLEEVELLSGCIVGAVEATGPSIVDDLRREHGWIGEQVFGGSGTLPLHPPHAWLAGDGVALVGNAAGQVFSPHGSGVGIGLVAARVLADAIAQFGDPGGPEACAAYRTAFHRRWSGLLAGYDIVRRATQRLDAETIARLMASGLVDAPVLRATLAQRWPTAMEVASAAPSVVRSLPAGSRRGGVAADGGAWGWARARGDDLRLLASLTRALARVPTLLSHYARAPEGPESGAWRAWTARGATLTAASHVG
jgi:flavin-dependent dehydrogenase